MRTYSKILLLLLLISPWMIPNKNYETLPSDNFDTYIPRNSSTSFSGNLNLLLNEDHIFESTILSGEKLFNITCSSTGDADLFFYFTSNISKFSFFENEYSMEWSDNFLTEYGKPLWGGSWNSWELNNSMNSGIEITAGNEKSFLISIGNNDTFDLRIFIRLIQTTNSLNNTYDIEMDNLLDTNAINSIIIGNQENYSLNVPANGFTLFRFEPSILSNEIVLLENISVNNGFSWIYWHDTLNGLWNSVEEIFSENISREWVPLFNNFDLTGRNTLGLILNPSGNDLEFNYYSELADKSENRMKIVDYSVPSMLSDILSVNDTLTKSYFALEIQNVSYFDIEFQVDLNWSISVDFFSLGTNHGKIDAINNQEINGFEKLSIFYAPISNVYQDRDEAPFIDQGSSGRAWYVANGTLEPEMKKINDLSTLIGFQINAVNMGINPELNISVQIVPKQIENYSSGEEVGIGKTASSQETEDFPFFQVRKMNVVNWERYQWELQAFNQSSLISNSFWLCGIEGSFYYFNMNNSLYSPNITETSSYTDLKVEAQISFDLSRASGNDEFSVYIKNETTRQLLDEFTGNSNGIFTYSRNISNWIGSDFSIEFNLKTNSNGNERGVTVDDFSIIGNSSIIVYENNFEGALIGWIHADYSGSGDLWKIAMEEAGVNDPVVDIVYQDLTYSMIGLKPSVLGIGAYPKIFIDRDPGAQHAPLSYLVYYASGPILDNITVKLSNTNFDPILVTNNIIKYTNNYTYNELILEGNEILNITKILDRTTSYFKLSVADFPYFMAEFSENSLLEGHNSIDIKFYNQHGQNPFTFPFADNFEFVEGFTLTRQIKSADFIIVSISNLTYEDYIELNIYATTGSDNNLVPTIVIIILSIISAASITAALLLYRKLSIISRDDPILSVNSQDSLEKTNPKSTANENKTNISETKISLDESLRKQ